jgi:hypothetical protein
VTSPQAFEGLRMAKRKVRAPEKTLLVVDHNVPTTADARADVIDPESKAQIEQLAQNAADFGLEYYDAFDKRQGIVHIIGPEQGFTLPGTTIVCGDSHTSTHGAFGALAHGIGTSEVEHVLATQTLIQKKAKNMLVKVNGKLPAGVTAKDIILAIIGKIGTAGGTGHVIEFAGEAIRDLTMEGRMTVCNMTIEGGARAGLIAPDEKTFAYRAWVASLATPEKPEHPEQMARLGWQYVECPACGSEGARAFPKPEEQQSCDKQEPCKGENCGSINPKLHSAECFDEHESTVLNIKPFGYFEFVLDDGDGYWREIEDGGIDGKPLYTSPPQRQPLTDAEIWQMVNDCSFNRDLHADKFARAIEAKLKEKNT